MSSSRTVLYNYEETSNWAAWPDGNGMKMAFDAQDSPLDKTTLAILDSLPFGVYYCDASLTVRYINKPYADYLGVRPRDVISRKITDFLPNSRAREVMQSGEEELYDVASVQRDKAHQRILVNRIPVRNDRGKVVGFISQLMSVGSKGWNDVWQKIEYAEKMMRMMRPAAPAGRGGPNGDIRESIIGESPRIKGCIRTCLALAKTDEAVLITGPTGVGKELFANAIHRCSPRAAGPLVSINCASMTKEFIASELFGYAPGAFTGAARRGKPGQIELADKGTLFLDEIGDIPPAVQGVLLRVLETHQVQRINATTSTYVDFRLVSATNQDLGDLVRRGLFRRDLLYRLNSLTLPVPRLDERVEDIPILARHFLRKLGAADLEVAPAAMRLLQGYAWPGNVRELRNVTTQAAVHAGYRTIRPQHLPAEIVAQTAPRPDHEASEEDAALERRRERPRKSGPRRANGSSPPPAGSPPDAFTLAARERHTIIEAIRQENGNLTQTARLLGISRTTLYEKIRKHQIAR